MTPRRQTLPDWSGIRPVAALLGATLLVPLLLRTPVRRILLRRILLLGASLLVPLRLVPLRLVPLRLGPLLLGPSLLGALAAVPAHAAGSVSCSLAATPLAFGAYAPSSSVPADFTATITVTCTATGATAVPLQGSIALIGATSPHGRQLAAATYRLRYHTYLDPARTIFWGDGTGRGGIQQVTGMVGPGMPLRRAFTVYGRILARQTSAHAGTYVDHLTAILNY